MSNLLEKASILLTPTAYDDGKILSVKPEDGTGDFTFTRNSSATRVNSQGLIEDMQILSGELVSNGNFSQIGPEQIENGDFATDSDWTKAAGWTISGGTANATSAASGSPLSQYVDVGKTYKITYDVVSLSQGAFQVDLSFSGTALGQLVTTTGTFTDFITSINPALSIRAVGTTTGSITNVSAKEVGQDWILDAGWSISEGLASRTNTGAYGAMYQNCLESGKKYKVTIKITSITSQAFFGVRLGTNYILQGITQSGTYTAIGVSTSATLSIMGNPTFAGSIDSIKIIEITDDTNLPRIDYSPYSGAGTCGHWLFEPQSTNLIDYSEDLSQSSWLKQGAGAASAPSVTANFAISPEGTQNASRVVFDLNGGTTSSDFSQLQENISGTVGNDYTSSVYLKSNNSNTYSVTFIPVSGSTTIVTVTPEWQRFSLSATLASANLRIRTRGSEGSSDVTDILIWCAQVEEQSFATSYIPTSGSTVTRLQDAAFGAGSSDLINSTEGVLYVEASKLVNGVQSQQLTISDGTNDNLVIIQWNSTASRFQLFVRGGAGAYDLLAINNIPQTDMNKIALSWDSVNYYVWINGVKLGTKVLTNQPIGLNDISFDQIGNAKFFGKTKCVAVFKEALTDAELTCLTTI